MGPVAKNPPLYFLEIANALPQVRPPQDAQGPRPPSHLPPLRPSQESLMTPLNITFHSNGTADVTARSMFSGQITTRTLPITPDQFRSWAAGEFIQYAMPHLSDDDREFLLTGATQEEWDEAFKEPEPTDDPS